RDRSEIVSIGIDRKSGSAGHRAISRRAARRLSQTNSGLARVQRMARRRPRAARPRRWTAAMRQKSARPPLPGEFDDDSKHGLFGGRNRENRRRATEVP